MENEHLTPSDGHPWFQAKTHNRTGSLHLFPLLVLYALSKQNSNDTLVLEVLFLNTERRKLERELGAIQKDPINSNS